uniref:Uncharacterized protein n=1 Tax=Trichogramma kaykai TaxID=54128 RepID=A0ABD2WV95_9HYME
MYLYFRLVTSEPRCSTRPALPVRVRLARELPRSEKTGRQDRRDAVLKDGADLESVDRHGDTPLQTAVAGCDADLVRCLLRTRARDSTL